MLQSQAQQAQLLPLCVNKCSLGYAEAAANITELSPLTTPNATFLQGIQPLHAAAMIIPLLQMKRVSLRETLIHDSNWHG